MSPSKWSLKDKRKIVNTFFGYWYLWVSLLFVYIFETPSQAPDISWIIPIFLRQHPLLVVLLSFLFVFIILPNWILYPILWKKGSRLVNEKNYPKKYFETTRSANNAILVIVGLVMGLFKFTGRVTSFHESRMLMLLFLSAFSGMVAIIAQITPAIKPACQRGEVKAYPLTVRIMFSATYFQIVFGVLGLFEAYLSLV